MKETDKKFNLDSVSDNRMVDRVIQDWREDVTILWENELKDKTKLYTILGREEQWKLCLENGLQQYKIYLICPKMNKRNGMYIIPNFKEKEEYDQDRINEIASGLKNKLFIMDIHNERLLGKISQPDRALRKHEMIMGELMDGIYAEIVPLFNTIIRFFGGKVKRS